VAITEIANHINQTYRAPLRADIERAKYSNALLKADVNMAPAVQRSRELANQSLEQNISLDKQAFTEQQKANARGLLAQRFAAVAQSANPQVAAQQLLADPNFRAAGTMLGLPVDQFTPDGDPEQLRSSSADWARALGSEVAQQSRGYRVEDGPGGSKFSVNQDTGQYSTLLGREPQQPTPAGERSRYRTLSPEEVKLAGLPPGSSAQLNELTGQISILNKADTSGGPAAQRPTEAMNKAAGLVTRMRELSVDVLNTAPSLTQQAIATFAQSGGVLGGLANSTISPEQQKHFNAARGWLAGILRQDTGATIQPFEIKEYYPTYFPVPGDSPQVIEQKRQLRASVERQMEQGAGSALLEQPQGGGLPPIIPNSSPAQSGQGTAPSGVVSWDQL
jgi:hypothetical protein